MSDFLVVGKVVVISKSLFNQISTIISKISLMHGLSCGDIISYDACGEDNCSLVLYVDISDFSPEDQVKYGTTITLENLVKYYYEAIQGFLIIKLYDSHSEIYNVCVGKCFRGQGIARIMLKTITEKIPEKWERIWLGIKLDNPMFGGALKSYVSSGFTNPVIQFQTPSGYSPGFPFLSLTFNKNDTNLNQDEVEKVVDKANDLRNTYLKEQGVCQMNVSISKDYQFLDNIYNDFIISQKIEYGGVLGIISYNKKQDIYDLGVPKNSITAGDKNYFAVQTPLYFINWHTHPYICYKQFKCYIGWPSGADMANSVVNYLKGNICQLVFTVEGIYIIQLTPGMMRFMNLIYSSEECLKIIYEITRVKFGDIESLREVSDDSNIIKCLLDEKNIECRQTDIIEKDEYINKFNVLSKTATINDLLKWGEVIYGIKEEITEESKNAMDKIKNCITKSQMTDVNFPIFNMKYVKWKEAKTKGVNITLSYVLPPENASCPLPLYKDVQIFGPEIM